MINTKLKFKVTLHIVGKRYFTSSKVLLVGPVSLALKDLIERKKNIYDTYGLRKTDLASNLKDIKDSGQKIHSYAVEIGQNYNTEEKSKILNLTKRVWKEKTWWDSEIETREKKDKTSYLSGASSQDSSNPDINSKTESEILEMQHQSVNYVIKFAQLLSRTLQDCNSYRLEDCEIRRFNNEIQNLRNIENITQSLLEEQIETLTSFETVAKEIEGKQERLHSSVPIFDNNENDWRTRSHSNAGSGNVQASNSTNTQPDQPTNSGSSGVITTIASTMGSVLQTAAEVSSNISDTGFF